MDVGQFNQKESDMNTNDLSDKELIASLVGPRLAERIYHGSLASLVHQPNPSFARKKLFIAQEFVRRALQEELSNRKAISSISLMRDYLKLTFAGKEHEVFMVMLLDTKGRLIDAEELFRGTLAQAAIYSREVVKCTLKYNAASVIFAHNHPSGVAQPSDADYHTTHRLQSALSLIDVKVLDHFVIAGNECWSFAENGLI